MSNPLSLVAVAFVCLTTLVVGGLGLRLSRRTSDFYVAGRTVSPRLNASAIGGEYLSAASFLGVAGLIYDQGVDMLWLPVGYTLGYLVLLVVVAAPMRRSGAYTLPDFAEARLGSRAIRLVSSALVIGIGWLYLVPQFQGASLTLTLVTGAPAWVGGFVVMVVIALAVGAGGMRSITFVQAVQYWIKLTALAVPAFVLLALWFRSGAPAPQVDAAWHIPLSSTGPDDHPAYRTASTVLALCLGTMGLPHVLVRYYTNPDGLGARPPPSPSSPCSASSTSSRRSTGRSAGWPTRRCRRACGSDSIVLRLPETLVDGLGGQLLTAMLAGGAFAAFLSTASGLAMSVTGVIDQELLRPRLTRLAGGDVPGIRGFRVAAVIAVVMPYVVSRVTEPWAGDDRRPGVRRRGGDLRAPAHARRLVAAALDVGGDGRARRRWPRRGRRHRRDDARRRPIEGWPGALLANPAMWSMPLALTTAVIVSFATPSRIPAGTTRTMVRLHTPERVVLARSRISD